MSEPVGARIMDCDWSVQETAGKISDAGIKTVIRYYSGKDVHAGKILSQSELDALDAHGLSVAIVFQHNNSVPENFLNPKKKQEDVAAALQLAHNLHQPPGSAIYFGIDYNIEGNPEQPVLDYFEHAHAELSKAGFKVGVYGCGRVAEMLSAPGNILAEYFWLSASVSYLRTSDFFNSHKWHLFQNKTEIPSELIPATYIGNDGKRHPMREHDRRIDTDVLNDRYQDFGQWRKDGSRPPHAPEESTKVIASRAFATKRPTRLFRNPDQASPSIGHVDYGRNVRILEWPDALFRGVSLNEGDHVDGYCLTAELTADLSTMPPW